MINSYLWLLDRYYAYVILLCANIELSWKELVLRYGFFVGSCVGESLMPWESVDGDRSGVNLGEDDV